MNKRVVSIVVLAVVILAGSLAGIGQAGVALSRRPVLALLPTTGTAPQGCIDLLCPDGRPRDKYCQCRPMPATSDRAALTGVDPDTDLPATGTQRWGCITLLCPDGSPRDAFCRCKPTVWSSPTS